MIGLLRSLLALIANVGNTHIACAFDHVIESFRNNLFPGYKTGAGINQTCLLNSRTIYICKHLVYICKRAYFIKSSRPATPVRNAFYVLKILL